MPSMEPMTFFPPEVVTNQMSFTQRAVNLLMYISVSISEGWLTNVTDTSVYAPEKETKTLS